MAKDIGAALADQWNRAHQETASTDEFWPLMRILSDAGLVTGDEQSLTTLQLGPFRIAATPYERATRDFLDVLLPSLVVGAADGVPLHGVIAGTLTAGTRCFVELLRRGVVFGRSPADRVRWAVLIHIKEHRPTADDLADAHHGADIPAVLTWLTEAGLVVCGPDGSWESLA
ncbi:hypothetical protein GCM10009555_050150 [Acrocarpospora macrocephala]|uniref:Uncharacterized protein n=1 Tax=Acrocarpospora macrocephala TaxID=150177 RepID=A0A5M3WVE5_9ACTN|nr:hypothetical protein [Acrocarpospora macrocephala]GES12864.1 hypothetical protein Amac_064610 [Acrocarpospora macrocephala]